MACAGQVATRTTGGFLYNCLHACMQLVKVIELTNGIWRKVNMIWMLDTEYIS